MTSMIRLTKYCDFQSCLPALAISLASMEVSSHNVSFHMEKPKGHGTDVSHQHGAEALSQTTQEDLNSINNHMSEFESKSLHSQSFT